MHVAFFRNTNLGRPRSPSRVQFEDAFRHAGADTAHSFLTNGTMVFGAGSDAAQDVAERARARLGEVCGLVEPVFVRSLAQLARLVASQPFDAVDTADVYERCATFLPSRAGAKLALPLQSARGDVELFARQGDVVFSLSRKVGASPGSPNALLEKMLDAPATTRNWNTVCRLVAKFA